MKRKILPVVVGSLSMILVAQHSTGQPAPTTNTAATTQPANAQGRRAMGPVVARLLRMQAAGAVTGEITDAEWKNVEAFMQQNSPDRLRQLNRLPDEKKPNVKRAMVGRFRMLEEIRRTDPVLYDIWVQKLQVEDDRFTLLRAFRRPRQNDDPKETEAKLRANIAEGVRLELDERQHRLANLERAVDDEKTKLADDRRNEDTLINEQLTRVETGQENRFGEGFRRPVDSTTPAIREASVDTPTTVPDGK